MISKKLRPFGTTIFTRMSRLAEEEGAINLSQGFPDFDGPLDFARAAEAAILQGHNQYARSMGCPGLVKAVADKVERQYGMKYDPFTEVTIFNGATEGIASTFLGFLNPGDEVVIFEPHYDSYPACAAMAGAVPRFYTLRFPDFIVDLRELERCFSSRTRLLLINTPHNPTGKVFSREELEGIAGLCRKYDVMVVTDEVYEHLTYDGVKHVPMAAIAGMRERTLTVSSAAKTFSITGWKIGWATGPSGFVAAAQAAHQFLSFATASPLQYAMATVMGEVGEGYYVKLREQYTARRNMLLNALKKAGLRPASPEGTYYILADFNKIWDDDDQSFVYHLIKQCKVAAIPASVFYSRDTDEGKRLVRFAFCKRIETLLKAAEQLEHYDEFR